MDIPEEIRDKIDRKMIYRMRNYNPYIMGLGAAVFFAMFVGGGVFGWNELGTLNAVLMIAGGFVFSFILVYLALGNKAMYEIGPESITFSHVLERSIHVDWSAVSKLEAGWLATGGGGSVEMRIFGEGKHPLRIDNKVPQCNELFLLAHYHLKAHGKNELIDQFSRQLAEIR
jgi:hypothetical protein